MSSETRGGKEGQLLGTQPRMRLDLPPGGFLRPDPNPAVGSSAAGASSWCSGAASGSAAKLSEHRQSNQRHLLTQEKGLPGMCHFTFSLSPLTCELYAAIKCILNGLSQHPLSKTETLKSQTLLSTFSWINLTGYLDIDGKMTRGVHLSTGCFKITRNFKS